MALAPLGDLTAPIIRIVPFLSEVLDAPEKPATIAVDMPIGLPELIEGPGRAPERHVRPLLGARQSSVFSMPARAAVYAESYAEACREAAARSHPSRKISKQGFMIFPKIREVDALLRARPEAIDCVFESHPEVAFVAMNGGAALNQPKKVKGKPWPAGMEQRRALLASAGIGAATLSAPAPKGAALDDLLDALACLVTARAIARGEAQSFPPQPMRDAHGIAIAIWAPMPQTSARPLRGVAPS